MAIRVDKNATIDYEHTEGGTQQVKKGKKSKYPKNINIDSNANADYVHTEQGMTKRKPRGQLEYPRGIKKIASYGGVARIMKCEGKCGGFDEIVNIYVYPLCHYLNI